MLRSPRCTPRPACSPLPTIVTIAVVVEWAASPSNVTAMFVMQCVEMVAALGDSERARAEHREIRADDRA